MEWLLIIVIGLQIIQIQMLRKYLMSIEKFLRDIHSKP